MNMYTYMDDIMYNMYMVLNVEPYNRAPPNLIIASFKFA
jgi:hypothetical protein